MTDDNQISPGAIANGLRKLIKSEADDVVIKTWIQHRLFLNGNLPIENREIFYLRSDDSIGANMKFDFDLSWKRRSFMSD